MLTAGLVVALRDSRVRPKGRRKWHVCVCPKARLFLRINSRNLWPPWHFLESSKNAFLEHDSYVELRELYFFPEHTLRGAREIGRLTPAEARRLAEAAQSAATLTQEWRELIRERLSAL
jgi:hypothetical protein